MLNSEYKELINNALDYVAKEHDMDEISICAFPQYWPNTAGPWIKGGQLAGQMITTTTTIAIMVQRKAFVFFGKHLGYKIEKYNFKLLDDLARQNLAAVRNCSKYEEKTNTFL